MALRRLISPLLAGIVALVFTAAPGCGKNPSAPDSVTQVVAFGDSLVFGVGTTGGNDFVSVLSRRVGVTILNAGVPGDTTGSALARLDTAVLARQPRIVIVLLGGNDILQGVPVDQRLQNLRTIAERLRAASATVILVGLGDGPIDPFASALPVIATVTSSMLVPGVLEGIFGNPALMADGIHPNNDGHAIMADRIEPALRTALAAVAQ
jgi:acyl-CoA thioesterase-1